MANKYVELDRRILGEAYGSSESMEVVTTLCDDYDSRWPGSGMDAAGFKAYIHVHHVYAGVNFGESIP